MKTLASYQERHNTVIQLKPKWVAGTYNNRGNVKIMLKQYQEAITDFNEAIKFNLNLDDAYYNRGIVKDKLGLYAEAIADFNEAIKLKPDRADAYNNRGIAKLKLDQHKEAILDFEKAIKLDPNLESKLRATIDQLKKKNSTSK